MHISEGVLSAPVLLTGWGATAAIGSVTLRGIRGEEIPKTAVLTSVFFVASLVHFPLGPFSAHLVLNGLVGVILGYGAFPSILLGLTLQALLFQHGGITVIGINALIMGVPAVMAHWIFGLRILFPYRSGTALFGFAAGASATAFSGIALALCLAFTGEAFLPAARLALLAHVPVMLVEGAVTASAVSFLSRVKPGVLENEASIRPNPGG